MHEAATEPHRIGDARLRSRTLRRASLLTGIALLCGSRPTSAQLPPYPVPLSNTEDARTLPKGTRSLVLPGSLFGFHSWGGTTEAACCCR